MDRINAIIHNHKYNALLKKIQDKEKNRIYCLHGLNHCLDVARIAYILSLEEATGISRDIIYAAALLHDTGRAGGELLYVPEEKELSHQELSCMYAEEILPEAGFNKTEIEEIIRSIRAHGKADSSLKGLPIILFRADKLSRRCFDCKAKDTCYWDEDKKNKGVVY
jgi:HD superfamily phosphodiesterase